MSDFETVPVGTMEELKRVKAERDALSIEHAVMDQERSRERLSRVKAENREHTLAAHVERIRQAWRNTEGMPGWEECKIIDFVISDTPTTSLARLKAEWQAEAHEATLREFDAHRSVGDLDGFRQALNYEARGLRRQAEALETFGERDDAEVQHNAMVAHVEYCHKIMRMVDEGPEFVSAKARRGIRIARDRKPETSLVRLKADWQAEAYDFSARLVKLMGGEDARLMGFSKEASAYLESIASDLRRQAEEN